MSRDWFNHDFFGYFDPKRARECRACGRDDCHPCHRNGPPHDVSEKTGKCKRCGIQVESRSVAA